MHVSVHDHMLKVYKPLVEFYHIYNFGAVGDRDKLKDFGRSVVTVTVRPNMVK